MTLRVDDLFSTDMPFVPERRGRNHSLRNTINQAFLSNFSDARTITSPEAERVFSCAMILLTQIDKLPSYPDFHLAKHRFL
jgi:hypothetical protein